MGDIMFESARLKLQRADYHISDLERQFAAFVAEKPHRFIVQSDPNTGSIGIRVRFVKEVPTALALVIGDAIHNLRASLDGSQAYNSPKFYMHRWRKRKGLAHDF
jgi:hypothetical protein